MPVRVHSIDVEHKKFILKNVNKKSTYSMRVKKNVFGIQACVQRCVPVRINSNEGQMRGCGVTA